MTNKKAHDIFKVSDGDHNLVAKKDSFSCKKMKIFMISNATSDTNDAQAIHIKEVFNNLSDLCDIYLFAPKPRDVLNFEDIENITRIPMTSLPILKHILFNLFLFIYLIRRCLRTQPDVFYVRYSIFLYSYILISKIFKIPFVVEVNELSIEEFKINNNRGLLATIAVIAFTKLSEELKYKHAKKIITVSPGIKRYILTNHKININDVIIIPNGANTDLFRPIDQEKLRKKLGVDNNYIYVGFSGSFSRWHGLVELVKSAPLILKKDQKAKFILVGNGTMKKLICQMVTDLQINDSFVLFDAVPYKEVPKYINAFDIGVILKEKSIPGSPLKLWEYMACGIPVVATLSEDFNVLEKCNGGILANPDNPEEVSNAILTLLKNKKLRKEMGNNGRNYVIRNHSWKVVAERIGSVINEVLVK